MEHESIERVIDISKKLHQTLIFKLHANFFSFIRYLLYPLKKHFVKQHYFTSGEG